MITTDDLIGKPIPKSGVCPICFDKNKCYTHVFKVLRMHMVNAHGFPITNTQRDHKEQYNAYMREYMREYMQKHRQGHNDAMRAYNQRPDVKKRNAAKARDRYRRAKQGDHE